MAIEILMPALSPTMKEGNLAKWLKKEGDSVEPGEIMAEIETDKATMEVEAVDAGVIGKILVAEGSTNVKVNKLIAVFLEDGDDDSVIEEVISKHSSASQEANKTEDSNAKEKVNNQDSAPNEAPQEIKSQERIFASPVAKRIASEKNIDLSFITGSGPRGRIVKSDVLAYKSTANTGVVTRNPQEHTIEPLSTMRQVIASRLQESKQNIPHFYLTIDCEMDNLLSTRAAINAEAPVAKNDKPAYKISVNDMVIKAVGYAMKKVPDVNASWSDEGLIKYNNIDVSVAVAIDGGLITPIVKNADQKSIIDVSSEMKQLVKRAKANELRPDEFQGGGFSISNLGMYGIKNFNAIINPPQSCIMAVGTTFQQPKFVGNTMIPGTFMTISLSCDHRVVDGAVAANFLAAFKKAMECPTIMFV